MKDVQQLEGNVIMPIAQRWAVELPPAYGLISLWPSDYSSDFWGYSSGARSR